MDDAPHQDPFEAELIAMIKAWHSGERSEVAEPYRPQHSSYAMYDFASQEPAPANASFSEPSVSHYPMPTLRPSRATANRNLVSVGYYRFLLAVILALGVWAFVGNNFGGHNTFTNMAGSIAAFWVTATALRLMALLAANKHSLAVCLVLRLVATAGAIFCLTLLLKAIYIP